MMGVLPSYQDHGVGRMLKLRQREEAMSRGIALIEWTFDPLELKNAFFNIQRLGAIVRRYVLNQYGTTSSHLHGGLPTDRCVAEWHILEPPAHAVPVAEIRIPNDIAEIRRTDLPRAREIQKHASDLFQQYFHEHLAVTAFERRENEGVYLLAPWHSE
jgi:predicted GNAT superfamily acetyltransferase